MPKPGEDAPRGGGVNVSLKEWFCLNALIINVIEQDKKGHNQYTILPLLWDFARGSW